MADCSATPNRNPPLLRWAGSKRSAAQRLSNYWTNHAARYFEPFCGSCAVYFEIRPATAILSDINKDLILFYNIAGADPGKLFECFNQIERSSEMYYRQRALFPNISDDIERAATFFYLNRNCFNGLYRTNRRGEFNVPFSENRIAGYLSEEDFFGSCALVAKAKFLCGDFEKIIIEHVEQGDFVYLDPPYASRKRLPFKNYHPESFDLKDIERLYDLLIEIDRRRAKFILSYDDGEAISRIEQHWGSHRYEVRRNISGFAGARRYSTEQIITNLSRPT